MKLPQVSIIIPAYNTEKYIGQTIESLNRQTFKDIEIIIVNDGSTDDTLAVAKQFECEKIKVISQTNKGQDAAINNGYKHSSGNYVKFMDADDLLNADMIEKQMNCLNGSDEHVAYGEWARFYNDKPELANFTSLDYWKDAEPLDFLTARPEGVMLQCGIMLVPRKLIEKAGLWDERLILYNDTEFYTRILLQSKGIKFSKGARLYYRSGMNGSISAGRSRRFFQSTFLATQLIAEQLLAVEDSFRIRNLISNTYLNQYYRMYPYFPDLILKHEKEIAKYKEGTAKPDGGKLFKILSSLMGWQAARRIQAWFYEHGYTPKKVHA